MTGFAIAVFLCAVIAFGTAEDDGQYKPHLYGDDGKYRPSQDLVYYQQPYNAVPAVYKNYYGRNYYGRSLLPTYQPLYYRTYSPFSQVLAPYVSYGGRNSVDQEPFGSAVAAVTYRPPVNIPVSTVAPVTFPVTPKTVIQSQVYARPYEGYARTVEELNDSNENSYRYLYKTDNGIAAEEVGNVNPSVAGSGTRASGFYQYVGDDGKTYRVDYTADENGFRPVGAHLPKNLA